MEFSEPITAIFLIFALLALGEFISILSKARIPMLFIVLAGYLGLLWTGIFPSDVLEQAHLVAIASVMPAPLIVHMGTMIPFEKIKNQYKAVLIALSGVVVATIFILAVGIPIIGYKEAVSGAGPLTGGIIAFIITSEKLQEMGLVSLITIPALILGVQKIIGMPLASFTLRKYALDFKNNKPAKKNNHEDENNKEKNTKFFLPRKYQTPIVFLFLIFLGGAIAVALGNLTGINYSLWALVIGFLGVFFGFYKDDMMKRANSFGITMALLIIVVMESIEDVTPGMFTTYLPHVLLLLFAGITGLFIGGFIATKLLKWHPFKGVSVALTALFGFPADYILCEEVSRSVGKDADEEKEILDEILAPMLIGGFTTVTVASVLIASILISTF